MSSTYEGHKGRDPLAMAHSADRIIAVAENMTGIDRVETLNQAIRYLVEARLFGLARAIERWIALESPNPEELLNKTTPQTGIFKIAPLQDKTNVEP